MILPFSIVGEKAKTSTDIPTATSTSNSSNQQPQQQQLQLQQTRVSNGDTPRMAEDLTKLISRLETVTSRLENIAQHTPGNLAFCIL